MLKRLFPLHYFSRKKHFMILFPVLLLCTFIADNNVFADENKSSLSIAVKSRFDALNISLIEVSQSIYDISGLSQKRHIIEEKNSKTGVIIGPEMAFSYSKLFARGFYLQGENNFFDSEKGNRKYYGAEIGIGKEDKGFFLGWREMDFVFNNLQSSNIRDHNITTPVWGFNLSSKKPGFFVDLGIATNLLIFQIGKSLDDVFIFDGEAHFGYRFKQIPLSINAGYEYWWFGKAVDGYYIFDTYGNPIKQKTVQFEDSGHGPDIKITYSF